MRSKRIPIILLAIACLVGFTATTAQADPLNLRPKFSTSELSELKSAFDSITSDGDYDIDIVKDQHAAAIWKPVASLVSVAKMVSEIASMPDGSSFGLYKYGDTSTTLTLFDDSSDANFGVTLNFGDYDGDGDWIDLWATNPEWSSTEKLNDFGMRFGFFYTYATRTGTATWYSEDSRNNKEAHMLIYPSNKDEKVNITGTKVFGNKLYAFDAGHHYVAVEQGGIGDNDNPDFTDFVAQFESITPAPEPGTLALFGVAGLACLVIRRRRKS